MIIYREAALQFKTIQTAFMQRDPFVPSILPSFRALQAHATDPHVFGYNFERHATDPHVFGYNFERKLGTLCLQKSTLVSLLFYDLWRRSCSFFFSLSLFHVAAQVMHGILLPLIMAFFLPVLSAYW